MAKKLRKTRERRPRKKNGKRTRKHNKKIAKEESYLATTNADNNFVMVEKVDEGNAAVSSIRDDPSKIVVGKIYANWCGHCQSMKDEWDVLEEKVDKNVYIVLNTEESEIPNRVDEINNIYLKNSDEKLAASGYPTIYRIEQGQLKYYGGDRTADAMYDWFVNQKGGGDDVAEKVDAGSEPQKVKEVQQQPEKKGWFSWW